MVAFRFLDLGRKFFHKGLGGVDVSGEEPVENQQGGKQDNHHTNTFKIFNKRNS